MCKINKATNVSNIFTHGITETQWNLHFKKSYNSINYGWMIVHLELLECPKMITNIEIRHVFIIKNGNNNMILHSKLGQSIYAKTWNNIHKTRFIMFDVLKTIDNPKIECFIYFNKINDQSWHLYHNFQNKIKNHIPSGGRYALFFVCVFFVFFFMTYLFLCVCV